ncbi:hypothetical protein IQ235_05305 [Oscillatoriales cyanobacterium LEGE 11467]|uniref:Uncharacterized protein n=1 Tax=Zarconia navalis LEGE 11467 TaxID=1828826 RepID=A0A928Z861_9CYAN|nr:hypothetical protein [Zarconia navalis]MBE9040209.1 hypothetical protein [Zarconia navalis LEGE 11467]
MVECFLRASIENSIETEFLPWSGQGLRLIFSRDRKSIALGSLAISLKSNIEYELLPTRSFLALEPS